jgi:hypothetical protein
VEVHFLGIIILSLDNFVDRSLKKISLVTLCMQRHGAKKKGEGEKRERK